MKKLTVNKGWMVGIEYQRRIAGIVSRSVAKNYVLSSKSLIPMGHIRGHWGSLTGVLRYVSQALNKCLCQSFTQSDRLAVLPLETKRYL